MKKVNKTRKLPIFIIFTTVLLASSFTAVNATTSIDKNKEELPDFLENLLVTMLPKASKEELDRVREIWIKQIALNEEKAVVAKETILKYESKGTKSITYIENYLDEEEYGGGTVSDNTNMEGLPDYYYARFLTQSLNAGASIVGDMSGSAEGLCYITAKLGPTGWGQNGNYFTVFGNFTPELDDENWVYNFIGYGQVTSNSSQCVYIGISEYPYSYIAVGVTTSMGGNCTYNDVLGDGIHFIS